MKHVKGWAAAAAVALALGTGTAWAAPAKGSVTVDVRAGTRVAGKELPEGSYTVAWKGAGGDVALVFKADGKVVAETKARFEERDQPSPYNALLARADGSGAQAVAEVRLRGRRSVLVVDPS
jgi:multidrug efflux pump subunit AcrA (membrane-fusion protein)